MIRGSAIVFVLAVSLLVTACDSQDANPPEQDIYGFWRVAETDFNGDPVDAYQHITDSTYVMYGRVQPVDCYREISLRILAYDHPTLKVGLISIVKDPLTGETSEREIFTEYTVSSSGDTLIVAHNGPGAINKFVPTSLTVEDMMPVCDPL